MKIHRFYYSKKIEGDSFSITDKDIVHQITRVLKLTRGEKIELFDGNGTSFCATLTSLSKNEISLQLDEKKVSQRPKKHVALFFALLKKENTEYAIEKAVEVGVSDIIPITTSRTVKTGIKVERINSIIKEATEQSGRTYLPKLFEIMSFKDALLYAQEHFSRVVVFDPHGTTFLNGKEESVALFVGPEGGFTQEELLHAQSSKCEVVSLPTHTLRGETAAIISVYTALL